jgi:divalent metal cation (Fe/Co/Zn/Cd) transporter
VDLRIGVTNAPREVVVELADDVDREKLRAQIDIALADESVLWVTDKRGKQIGVPGAKIAYVEVGSPDADRRMGFGG